MRNDAQAEALARATRPDGGVQSPAPRTCEMHGLPYVEGRNGCEQCLALFNRSTQRPEPPKSEKSRDLCKIHGFPITHNRKCGRCWSDIQMRAQETRRAKKLQSTVAPAEKPAPVSTKPAAAFTPKPATPRPSDGRGAGGEGHPAVGEGPRIVIEGTAAQRIVRLIQMHRVAGQLDPADADAVRDVVQRQAGLCVLENAR